MHQIARSRHFLSLALLTLAAGGGCGSPDMEEPGTGGTGGGRPAAGGAAGSVPVAGAGGSQGVAGSGGSGAGGAAGAGGSATGGSAGMAGRGGASGAGGRPVDAPRAADRPRDGATGRADGGNTAGNDQRFSFFYTSLDAMKRLSGSPNGFGGNLTFGTTSGLEGADKICQTIATGEGFGSKTWKAFLSVVQGPEGTPVHAIDRIGEGPWYDRNGRLIAMNKAGLLAGNRPMGDAQAVSDLADEKGRGRPTSQPNDTHDVITGTNRQGRVAGMNRNNTCQDWTSTTGGGSIQLGHSWPASSGQSWVTVHTTRSCAAGVNLVQNGPGPGTHIGSGGGWGGIYCFALTP
jgi:hypothetical protein